MSPSRARFGVAFPAERGSVIGFLLGYDKENLQWYGMIDLSVYNIIYL